jgi:hypothetical protein
MARDALCWPKAEDKNWAINNRKANTFSCIQLYLYKIEERKGKENVTHIGDAAAQD